MIFQYLIETFSFGNMYGVDFGCLFPIILHLRTIEVIFLSCTTSI